MSDTLIDIQMQVMWNRLVSVVEEQALTLIRTAFSTSVREAGDLSAGVFDRAGNMLAQAVTGTLATSTPWLKRWCTSSRTSAKTTSSKAMCT